MNKQQRIVNTLVEIQNRTMRLANEHRELSYELGQIAGLANRVIREVNAGEDLGLVAEAMRHLESEGSA